MFLLSIPSSKISNDFPLGLLHFLKCKFLDEFKSLTDEEFTKSYKNVQAAKYSLLEISESCIDIAAHLISISNLERPKTYAELFELLGEDKIINLSLSLTQNLSNMAKCVPCAVYRVRQSAIP